MKKLLVVILLFSIASSASALTVTLDPSGHVLVAAGDQSLNVVSDTDDFAYERFLVITDATYGDITSITVHAAAGDDATVTDLGPMVTYDSVWSVIAFDSPEPYNITAGTHFTATVGFTGAASGEDLTIELLDGILTVLDSTTYSNPEPTTIALLGLGGLFLMRRRK
jgi:hypothetical protein